MVMKRITAVILALVLCVSGACFAGNSASAWPGFCCLAPGEMPIGFAGDYAYTWQGGIAIDCITGRIITFPPYLPYLWIMADIFERALPVITAIGVLYDIAVYPLKAMNIPAR